MDPNRIIGADNNLPWYIPEDLKFFKKTTENTTVVMGRKTYNSLKRPLPNRRNIVLSTNKDLQYPGIDVLHNINELKTLAGKVFIIGGAQIYKACLPIIDELIISHVKKPYVGDTYFPEFSTQFKKEETLFEHEKFKVIKYKKLKALKRYKTR